jgi:hypothetical protein
MHRTPHRIDKEATEAAGFHSRYSYISLRVHPRSDPPHPCVYLAGLEDIGQRRHEVFVRDRFLCVDCGCVVVEFGPDAGELAHGGNTKISRCWCMANLSTKCTPCHRKNDHHGRDF